MQNVAITPPFDRIQRAGNKVQIASDGTINFVANGIANNFIFTPEHYTSWGPAGGGTPVVYDGVKFHTGGPGLDGHIFKDARLHIWDALTYTTYAPKNPADNDCFAFALYGDVIHGDFNSWTQTVVGAGNFTDLQIGRRVGNTITDVRTTNIYSHKDLNTDTTGGAYITLINDANLANTGRVEISAFGSHADAGSNCILFYTRSAVNTRTERIKITTNGTLQLNQTGAGVTDISIAGSSDGTARLWSGVATAFSIGATGGANWQFWNSTSNVMTLTNAGLLGIQTTPTQILSLGNGAARTIWIENSATDVVGRALTVAAGGTVAGTAVNDIAGGDLILQSGLATGAGANNIILKTGAVLASGKVLQTQTTRMTINNAGNVTITAPTSGVGLTVSGGGITSTGVTTLTGQVSLPILSNTVANITMAGGSDNISRIFHTGAGVFAIGSTNGGNWNFWNGTRDVAAITNNGRLGLGPNVTAPAYNLVTEGEIQALSRLYVYPLATPAAPVITQGGVAGAITWGYKITATVGNGETAVSVEGSTATGNATLDNNNYNIVTWVALAGATGYKVYRTTVGAGAVAPLTTGLIATIVLGTTLSLNDTGLAGNGVAGPTFGNTSRIGLGTNSPTAQLHLAALPNGNNDMNIQLAGGGDGQSRLWNTANGTFSLGSTNSGGWSFWNSHKNNLVITDSGDFYFSGGASTNNGQAINLNTYTTTRNIVAGASDAILNFIPAGSLVLGMSIRVTTAITGGAGFTGFDIGDGTDQDAWGANISPNINTTTTIANYTAGNASPKYYPAATNLVFTAIGNTFNGVGTVRATMQYFNLTAATS